VSSEFDTMMQEALRSYTICKIRNRVSLRPTGDLSKLFPDYFKKAPNGNFRWIGTTTDEIIEAYLAGYGYRQGSRLWHILCDIISRRATFDEE
jgi:hypothetical protein